MFMLDDIIADVLRQARAAGASAADALAIESDAEHVSVRHRSVEKVSQARHKRIGLRVFVEKSSAVVSTADLSPQSLARLVEDAVAFARVTAPDPCSGLPDLGEVIQRVPDLDLYDPAVEEIPTATKIALAVEAESAALESDPAITNSEGAEFSAASTQINYGTSLGFVGGYNTSSFSLHVVPVATRDGAMQRDYWYTADRKFDRLDPARSVGETAARRTLRRLGARKVGTCQVPIVFEPETAGSLLRNLAAAVSGSAIYRGTSFLRGKLGEAIASPNVTIHDDGTIAAALGSKPFDGEAAPTRKTVVVEGGVLRSYLLDTYAARKLDLRTTGNAARGIGDIPSVAPTNLFLLPGSHPPEEIIASVDRGLYVTELIGFGVNLVTGDYSRGAVGIWIEKGELTHAVEEITISGNLLEMFRDIELVGNDLTRRAPVSAPTLKLVRMTVAGT